MKKFIFGVLALMIMFFIYKKDEYIIIPNDAIRIRIIANSNNSSDLLKKYKVKKIMDHYLYQLLNNSNSIEEARKTLDNNLNNIDKILENENIGKYQIKYGLNYFPRKQYRGIVYQAGNYESLEIRLGEGIGSNYWCVLFPPLCMINENEIPDDVAYKLYIKKLFKIDN